MLFFIVWLLVVSLIGFTLISATEIDGTAILIGWFVLLLIGLAINQHFKVTHKPMLSTKGKVKSKSNEFPSVYGRVFHADFILSDGGKIRLLLSKKQHKALQINDIIELVYKSNICVSIKGSGDKSPIINTDYFHANSDIAQLMKLDAQEASKRAAKKAKRK